MKIVIASGIFVPELGGPATYAPKLAQEFLALGHQVKVLSYSDQSHYDIDRNFSYPVVRIKRSNKILNYIKYFLALVKNAKDADVIYAFDHLSAGLPAALFCQLFSKKLYIRVGGDFIWERYLENNGEALTLREFYDKGVYKSDSRFKIIKYVFSKATGIIFTTKFQRDIFEKYYNLDSKNLFIINNPIDKSQAVFREDISKDIIFAGRFINKNNILNLIKAFKNLVDDSYNLILIGEGPLQKQMEYVIAKSNLSNVKIFPKLSREELKQKIANAYMLVWPSLTDISPNSMLEALSIGVPIVSSREIGFDWLKDKIKTFNPKDVEDITNTIASLLDTNIYQDYQSSLSNIDYSYNYNQAAKDTINIFTNVSY